MLTFASTFENVNMCHCSSLLLVKTRFPRRLRCKEEEEEGGEVAEVCKEISKLSISGKDM